MSVNKEKDEISYKVRKIIADTTGLAQYMQAEVREGKIIQGDLTPMYIDNLRVAIRLLDVVHSILESIEW